MTHLGIGCSLLIDWTSLLIVANVFAGKPSNIQAPFASTMRECTTSPRTDLYDRHRLRRLLQGRTTNEALGTAASFNKRSTSWRSDSGQNHELDLNCFNNYDRKRKIEKDRKRKRK